MPSQYERDEAVRRAQGMLGGGFETKYIYEKLLSLNFSEDEAADILKQVTGKAFVKPIKAENKPSEAPKAAEKPIEVPMSFIAQEAAAKEEEKAEDAPASLGSLIQAEAPETQESKAESEVLETLDEEIEAAQEAGIGGGQEEKPEVVVLQESSEAPAAVPSPAPAASKSSPSAEYRRKNAMNLAATLYNGGYDDNYIVQKLIKEGFSNAEAKAITSNAIGKARQAEAYSQAYNKGKTNSSNQNTDFDAQVMIGVVMILIGCGVTFFSYQAAASNPSGGTYVVTFGLIIAGAVRVFKGLSNS